MNPSDADRLWKKVDGFVKKRIDRILGRHRVASTGTPGYVDIEITDGLGRVTHTETAPMIKRGAIRPGDRVLVVHYHDRPVVIGAIAQADDPVEDETSGHVPMTALYDPNWPGGGGTIPYVHTDIHQLYAWNGVRFRASTVNLKRLLVELDWAGIGGFYGNQANPARADHTHDFSDSGLNSVHLGDLSVASGGSTVALGYDATATGVSATAVGNDAVASGDLSVALGQNTTASGLRSTALGQFANATMTDTTAIGQFAAGAAIQSVAIGSSSAANDDDTVAIGHGAQANENDTVAIGSGATTGGPFSIAVGSGAIASVTSSIAIGREAVNNGLRSFVIGSNITNNTDDLGILESRDVEIRSGSVPNPDTRLGLRDTGNTLHWIGVTPSGITFDGSLVGAGSGTTALWGGITGTLADQADLQAALDGKSGVSHNHPASAITSGTLADARIPNLAASKITSGTFAVARLGTGTPNGSRFLRDDGTWADIPAGHSHDGAGTLATVLGASSSASGSESVAAGSDTVAGGAYSLALGHGAQALKTASMAIGRDTVVDALRAWAIGTNLTNTVDDLGILEAGIVEIRSGNVAIDETKLGLYDSSGLVHLIGVNASTITFDGTGLSLDGHTHDAGDVTSGTFADARIPSLAASKITSGTFADARIPNLAASKITSGTFAVARLGTGTPNGSRFLRDDGVWSDVPGGLTTENVQDIVGAMVTAGTGITATYDDGANTLTIAAPNDHTHSNKAVLDQVTEPWTTGKQSTLNLFYDLAVLKNTTTVAGWGWVVDEDTLSSNLDTKVPTQQSVKAYVDSGLSGKANTSHNHPASAITSGVFSTARLGTGTADSTRYLRGDGTWATIPGGLDQEGVEDIVGAMVSAGVGISISYIDLTGTLAFQVQDVPIDRVTNLQTSLDGKAASAHTHPIADIQATGTPASNNYLRGDGTWSVPPNTTYSAMSQAEMQAGTATTSRVITAQRVKEAVGYHPPAAHSHAWGDITGKPSTFAPSAHTHAIADVTDLQTELDGKVDEDLPFTIFRIAAQNHLDTTSGNPHGITPAMIGAALASHTHAAGDVTSGTFDTARIPNLDAGKITSGTFNTARIPNLAASKITSGTLADARIPSLAISKTTGLQDALDDKMPTDWGQHRVKGSNQSTTSNTDQNVTGMSVAIGANEVWEVTCLFLGGCEDAGGTRIGIASPSGSSQVQHMEAGDSTATGTTRVAYQSLASGSLARAWGKSAALSGGGILAGGGMLHVIINNGGTAGNIQMVFRSEISGQVSWVSSATQMIAKRIA